MRAALLPLGLAIVWTVGLLTVVVWLLAVEQLHSAREWHHAYIGLALMLVGSVLAARCHSVRWCVAAPLVIAFGYWILADDAWQHITQLHDPAYRSWWHRRYATVYDWWRRVHP